MATEKIQPTDPLSAVNNLLGMLQKAKGTTTTQSTSSNLTNDGAMSLLNQVLQSTQGLAAVSQGQKSAGLYNSTVNQQMINDLLTQTASKVASQQQGSTTVTKTSGAIGKGDMGTATKIIASLQAASQAKGLLDPLVKAVGSKYGVKNINDIGSKLADMVMGVPEAASGEVMAAVDTNGGATLDSLDTAQWEQSGSSAIAGLESLGSSIQSGAEVTGIDLSSFVMSPDSAAVEAVTDWNGNTNNTSLSDSEWNQMGDDATNFSAGSDASASSGSSTNYGSYIKAAKYIDDPEYAKDVFDFSDGDWKDDISDVTDAGSIYFPPLAAVRPALNSVDAFHQEAASFVSDPDQWFKDVIGGDSPYINNTIDMANGAVQSIVSTGDMIGRAGETVSNAVGDVVSGIGDIFGF